MSYSFPVMGRCRVTVTISVNKLLLRRKFEANPLVNRETMLGRPIASAKRPRTASTQLYDRAELVVGIAQALGNVRELARISKREIHEAVLSCTRAHRQTLRSMPTAKPTLH
jgi:hypothetical protein